MNQPKPKHTPGPWMVAVEDRELKSGFKFKQTVVIAREHDDPMEIMVNDTDNDTELVTANARLISAAPEMLEALERSLRWLTKALVEGVHEGTAMPNDLDACIDEVSALIAKARGES